MTNPTSLAAEMVAFANSGGGHIFLGVGDDGTVHGLTTEDVARLNQLISNAASNLVRPTINPKSEHVATQGGVVIVVSIADGLSKPYMDNGGAMWVKSGRDKRKVTSREEMQRMFQSAQLVHGDDIPIPGTSVANIEPVYFREFFKERFGIEFDEQNLSLAQTLSNMRLITDGLLTISGALLFARDPTPLMPTFHIKAIS